MYLGGSSSGGGGSAQGSLNDVVPHNGNDRSEEELTVGKEETYTYADQKKDRDAYEDQKMKRRGIAQKRGKFVKYQLPDETFKTEWDEL